MADGEGIERRDVMYNDFVLVGPRHDPAGAASAPAVVEAFKQIAAAKAPFASRGDRSGTDIKEKSLWAKAGIAPTPASGWYLSLGQGMGETLTFANEKQAYTLSDRGTFLSMRPRLPDLAILVGGATLADNHDPELLNPYGIIVVNPAKHPNVKADLAKSFAAWITSTETQKKIGEFGKDKYGQPLFYPHRSTEGTQNPAKSLLAGAHAWQGRLLAAPWEAHA
jgi:tungstate transport system substrate-binding protein